MSDKKKISSIVDFDLILLGIVAGIIDAYVTIGHDLSALLIGSALGILAGIIAVLGFIPVIGVFLYIWIMNKVFDYVAFKLNIVFLYGLGLSIFITVVISVVIVLALRD